MGAMCCKICGIACSRYQNDRAYLCEKCFEKGKFAFGDSPWFDTGPLEEHEDPDDWPITQEWLSSLELRTTKSVLDRPQIVDHEVQPELCDGRLHLVIRDETDTVELCLPHIDTRGKLIVLLLLLGFGVMEKDEP